MTIDFKQDILAPVAQDFATMDTFINEGITSKVALVMAVSKHVVEAGGKRMRPIMCLLAAKACGAEDLERQRKLAAIIEMLHTAMMMWSMNLAYVVVAQRPMQLGTIRPQYWWVTF